MTITRHITLAFIFLMTTIIHADDDLAALRHARNAALKKARVKLEGKPKFQRLLKNEEESRKAVEDILMKAGGGYKTATDKLALLKAKLETDKSNNGLRSDIVKARREQANAFHVECRELKRKDKHFQSKWDHFQKSMRLLADYVALHDADYKKAKEALEAAYRKD
jgi:hypothetical protein